MMRFVVQYINQDLRRYYDVIETWEFGIVVFNRHVECIDDEIIDRLPLDLEFSTSVRFPIEQLDAVKAIFI